MKKIIAIMLVLVLTLFSFAACNKDDTDDNDITDYGDYKPVEKFDEDKVKENWSIGEITFANGNKLVLPCTVKEFMEVSESRLNNPQAFESKKYQPDEAFTISLITGDTEIKIDCKNLTGDYSGYSDATVSGFNFYKSTDGNRQITVAGGLTIGVTRAEVESALGIPEGKTSEDRTYTYKTEAENEQVIRMTVSFNSADVVNAVVYKISDN
ncbi:MAG: hypothetical protein IJZ16_02660 [Clostridia bacterium]|nr:hypothetical protein [Clostridia bacterium]